MDIRHNFFPLVSMGAQAKRQAYRDPGVRAPIRAIGNYPLLFILNNNNSSQTFKEMLHSVRGQTMSGVADIRTE